MRTKKNSENTDNTNIAIRIEPVNVGYKGKIEYTLINNKTNEKIMRINEAELVKTIKYRKSIIRNS